MTGFNVNGLTALIDDPPLNSISNKFGFVITANVVWRAMTHHKQPQNINHFDWWDASAGIEHRTLSCKFIHDGENPHLLSVFSASFGEVIAPDILDVSGTLFHIAALTVALIICFMFWLLQSFLSPNLFDAFVINIDSMRLLQSFDEEGEQWNLSTITLTMSKRYFHIKLANNTYIPYLWFNAENLFFIKGVIWDFSVDYSVEAAVSPTF